MPDSKDLDDELEIEIRPAQELAVRLILLAAVVRRAMLELQDASLPDETPEASLFDLRVAIAEEPFASAATDDERSLLWTPIGRLGESAALDVSWRIEALAAIAAMTIPGVQMGSPWQQTEIGPLLARIPEPMDDLQPFVEALSAPEDEDAAFERERAELWVWRVAIDDDLRSLSGRQLADLRAILEDTVAQAVNQGLLDERDGDFAVEGQPFCAIDPELNALIGEISVQRLTALNWLCGFGESWDSVPLDL